MVAGAGRRRFKYDTGTSDGVRLAVCGGKGGCGKTTTALGLAGVLAEARRDPVVVDCDRDMPNLHVYAGTQDEPGVDHLAAATDPNLGLEGALHDAQTPAGVRVVPGVPGSDVAGALNALDAAEKGADGSPVILDVPAGVSEDVAVPLRWADATVLVTTPSDACLRATVKTAAIARALDAPVWGVVVSRAPGVPDGVPGAIGVPAARVVSVPACDSPLSSVAIRPLRGFAGRQWPNA